MNDRQDDAFNATAVVPGMGYAPPLAGSRRVPPLAGIVYIYRSRVYFVDLRALN